MNKPTLSTPAAPLDVSIQELPAAHVGFLIYRPGAEQGAGAENGNASDEIRQCFQRLQKWVSELGYDPFQRLTVGIPVVVDRQLAHYECCIQVPDEVQAGPGEIGVKGLPGGRYAVVTIEKNPEIIGDTIGRFYTEYAPQHGLVIDAERPTYEVYYQDTMEYCVPV